MGNDYFFPDLPHGGRMAVYDSDDEYKDEDDHDKYFASKLNFAELCARSNRVPEYSDEISNSVTNIDPSNFDVVSFLSTDKRDYLVRNDNYGKGDYNQVKVKSLRDKRWVMICCFFCPAYSDACSIWQQSLTLRAVSRVCSELYDSYGGSFEMVLVFKMMRDFIVDESAFRHQLSGFPSSCLVVPFWDSNSSDSLCRSLGFNGRGMGLFLRVDERKVVWHKELQFFNSYGLDTFPFTDDDIRKVTSNEHRQSWNFQSLENLLCCSSSTILYKNSGGAAGLESTTSVEQLKQKLVGVYLCLDGEFIPKLHEVYDRCKAINKEFEIVVVYLPFQNRNSDPQLFQTLINRVLEKRKISWWILPFRSWVSLRLSRLCPANLEDELIIVGKGFVDPCGAYIIRKIGMHAYPFSRKLMFDKETERISKVALASLLIYGERDYLLRNEDKVPVASLGGKNIFLFIDFDHGHFNKMVYGPLLKYYVDIKAKDPDFEIVYVGSYAATVCTAEMPWLVCPYDIHHFKFVSKEIFVEGRFRTTLVAFKKDGLVGSRQAHKHLSLLGVKAYPFDGSGLKQDVIDEFKFRYCDLPLGDSSLYPLVRGGTLNYMSCQRFGTLNAEGPSKQGAVGKWTNFNRKRTLVES